jgi:predicted RNA-binding Zn-ribbon protein involved in translation (DUF1610 family)
MNFLRNFMAGRYGPDHLNGALIIAALVVSLISRIIAFPVLMYLSYLFLILAVVRMLSRNIRRRRAENDRFLRYWWPIRQKLKASFSNAKYRKTHKFFKCPSCNNLLRVPRGRGKIQITCPKCGERFIRST